MGNSLSCCIPPSTSSSSRSSKKTKHRSEGRVSVFENGKAVFHGGDGSDNSDNSRRYSEMNSLKVDHLTTGRGQNGSAVLPRNSESNNNIQHISEREPEDGINDPSINPKRGPIFMVRSKSELRESRERKRRSQYLAETQGTPSETSGGNGSGCLTRKFNSCSTIYVDDSTVSQPNLRSTIKCVSLAVFYHIKNRENRQVRTLDIFEERLHPLSKDPLSLDYDHVDPEQRHVYRFLRTLFNAAQLTAECAIVTLVYLERLLTYAEMDIGPSNWKRMVLGAVLLASKVWDDQAVWNVDYCQILRDILVEDMNELERNFLELLQFNINVPASVYAKYYFDLRCLAETNDLTFPGEQLSVERAQKLEALSRLCAQKVTEGVIFTNAIKRSSSLDNLAASNRRSVAIIS